MPTLYKNPTSPFARIAHGALIVSRASGIEVRMVDQWSDPAELLAANPAARVPCLLLDDGTALTEALAIARHFEASAPNGAALGFGDTKGLAVVGLALGIADAAVQVMIGRRIVGGDFSPNGFDESEIGLRRRRTMVEGLPRLDAIVAEASGDAPDLATIAAVTAIDYVRFRFPAADWLPAVPRLDALEAATHDHPALDETRPPFA